jgi:hypothetical protein
MTGLPNIRDTWDFNDPVESERRFKSILAGSGLDLDGRLQVMTQIARALGLQSKLDEAHALLRKGVSVQLGRPIGRGKSSLPRSVGPRSRSPAPRTGGRRRSHDGHH